MANSKPAAIGHNSGVSGDRLKSFIERVERVEEEKQAAVEDIKDIYQEVRAAGFEPKIVKKIVAKRRKSKEALREEQELLALYLAAIGDDPDLAEVLS